MMCIENSNDAFSSESMEADTSDDILLEELTLTLFNKRQTIGNSKFSTDRNKRNRVKIETELRHHAHDDPWCIKKQLYKSDLRNLSRLLLPSELVESHVLLHWNADQLAQIRQ
ncbi:hypothetical protein Goklo_026844, partial [Gossypium klotzschianum]|nr:hypothetical protein [Gossypium klotzschianum]